MIRKSKKFLALGLSLAALASSVGNFSVFASDDEEVKFIGDAVSYPSVFSAPPLIPPPPKKLHTGDEPPRSSTLSSSLCSQRAFEGIEEIIFKFLTGRDSKSGSARTVISLDRLKELLLEEGTIGASKLDFIIPDERSNRDNWNVTGENLNQGNQGVVDQNSDQGSMNIADESLNQNDFEDIILLLARNNHRLVEEDAHKLLRKFPTVVREKIPEQKTVCDGVVYYCGGRGYYSTLNKKSTVYHYTVPATGEKSECINDVLFSYLTGLNLRTGEEVCYTKEISLEDFCKKYLTSHPSEYSAYDIRVSNFEYGYNTFFKLAKDGFRLSPENALKLLRNFWFNNGNSHLKPESSLRDFKGYVEMKYRHPYSPRYLLLCGQFESIYLSELSGAFRTSPRIMSKSELHLISWEEFLSKYLRDNELQDRMLNGKASLSEYMDLLKLLMHNKDFLSKEDSTRFADTYLKLYEIESNELEAFFERFWG